MTIHPLQRLKLAGIVVSVAALGYQPAMHASGSASGSTANLTTASSTTVLDSIVEQFGFTRGQSVANASMVSAPLPTPLTTVPTQLAQLANAPFVGVAHPTGGGAQIVESGGQYYLELDSAFHSEGGPDLFVLLHTEAVPSSYSADNYVNLGRLQAVDGQQRYAIPADVDINAFRSAVIWCRQFDVTFGYATL